MNLRDISEADRASLPLPVPCPGSGILADSAEGALPGALALALQRLSQATQRERSIRKGTAGIGKQRQLSWCCWRMGTWNSSETGHEL